MSVGLESFSFIFFIGCKVLLRWRQFLSFVRNHFFVLLIVYFYAQSSRRSFRSEKKKESFYGELVIFYFTKDLKIELIAIDIFSLLNVRFVCSHFTNYLKYIFYFGAVCTLYYISTHWDSSCYFSAYLHFSLLGQSEPCSFCIFFSLRITDIFIAVFILG